MSRVKLQTENHKDQSEKGSSISMTGKASEKKKEKLI